MASLRGVMVSKQERAPARQEVAAPHGGLDLAFMAHYRGGPASTWSVPLACDHRAVSKQRARVGPVLPGGTAAFLLLLD